MIDCPDTLNIGEHVTVENEEYTLEGVIYRESDPEGYIYIISDDDGAKLRIRGDLGRVIEWQGMEVR